MLADVLTKNLRAPDFARHRDVMAGLEAHTSPELPEDLTIPGPETTPKRTAMRTYAENLGQNRTHAEDLGRKRLRLCSLATSDELRQILVE